MAKTFDHAAVEAGWDAYWQAAIAAQRQGGVGTGAGAGAGVGDGVGGVVNVRPPFSIVFPPPNITGVLHIGHALTVTIQDALVRWRRAAGDDVLFVPGLDHAGIATQSVVERQLAAAGSPGRLQLGREAFVARVAAWASECGGRIRGQLRRLGGAFDWPLEAYTLDAPRSAAVTHAFVSLHRAGYIKRAARLVNWCPHLRTAISDIEVDVRQVAGPEMLRLPPSPGAPPEVQVGVMHTFAYPLVGVERLGKGGAADGHGVTHIHVSTTRLETMLGDVAVAVHPDDTRVAHWIGHFVRHPLTGRSLPVVGDATLVDPAVGTGAVKLTPAHDANDYAAARRHGLPVDPVFDDAGCIVAGGAAAVPLRYAGMHRFTARTVVAADLTAAGVYLGSQPHAMALALCSRSGDILEPSLRPQWFLDASTAAAASSAAARDGSLPILPAAYRREWHAWLDNPQDWCISRQLWWGHRIPAWRPTGGGDDDWVVAENAAAAAAEYARRHPGAAAGSVTLVQDADVLDTWFSSALFPLSALGWPAAPPPRHYPLSVMETGADILFFWVARMSMLCATLVPRTPHAGGAPDNTSAAPLQPFRQVLLHPVVRDRAGRKMSKSLGNVIDPLHVMDGVPLETLVAQLRSASLPPAEIKRASAQLAKEFPTGMAACGADALRLALALYMRGHGGRAAGATNASIHLDVTRIHAARLFCNKLWNAARFVIAATEGGGGGGGGGSGGGGGGGGAAVPAEPPCLPDAWLLHRCDVAAEAVGGGLAERDIGAAAGAAHDFLLRDVCDTYIEWVKHRLAGAPGRDRDAARATLSTALGVALRLLHPFMPFITEELHHRLTAWGLDGLPAGGGAPPLAGALLFSRFPLGGGAAATAGGVPGGSSGRDATLGDMALAIEVLHAARSVRKLAGDILGAGAAGACSLSVTLPRASVRDAAVLRGEAAALAAQLRLPAPLRVVVEDGGDGAAGSGGTPAADAVLTAAVARGVVVTLALPASDGTLAGLDKEVARLAKRAAKAAADRDTLAARMAAPAYAKVPASVQAGDAAAADAACADADALHATLTNLRTLRDRVAAALQPPTGAP